MPFDDPPLALEQHSLFDGRVIERLPNAAQALIPIEKIRSYALNTQNPRGRDKARMFRSILGYTQDDADELVAKLLAGVQETPARLRQSTPFGHSYEVVVQVTSAKATALVTTGWIVRPGSSIPTLVTAYIRKRDIEVESGP